MRIVCRFLVLALLAALMPSAATADSILLREGRIPLFNGENLEGWVLHQPDADPEAEPTWRVGDDGVLLCSGEPMGYLRTTRTYGNYRLTLQWRWPGEGGDSGVLLHVQDEDTVWPRSIEAQLASGNAGDFFVFKGVNFEERENPDRMRTAKLAESSEKKVGEWNELEVICDRDRIEVYVNGVLQNRATHPSLIHGHIALQSDGKPIEFRKIILHPLDTPTRVDQANGDERAQGSGQGERRGS